MKVMSDIKEKARFCDIIARGMEKKYFELLESYNEG